MTSRRGDELDPSSGYGLLLIVMAIGFILAIVTNREDTPQPTPSTAPSPVNAASPPDAGH